MFEPLRQSGDGAYLGMKGHGLRETSPGCGLETVDQLLVRVPCPSQPIGGTVWSWLRLDLLATSASLATYRSPLYMDVSQTVTCASALLLTSRGMVISEASATGASVEAFPTSQPFPEGRL